MRFKATTAAAVLSLVSLTTGAQAASLSLSQSQPNPFISGVAVDLTAIGTLDWAKFDPPNPLPFGNANPLLTPSDSMDGGAGFTSLSLTGAAGDAGFVFGSSNNTYSWTNGTATSSVASNTIGRPLSLDEFPPASDLTNTDGGVSLVVDVAEAGTYQVRFYTSGFAVNVDASASLTNGSVSDSVLGVNNPFGNGGIQQYIYTADFTTDGADTLTLNVDRASGRTLAIEAFTLSGTPVPEPSSMALLGLGAAALIRRHRRK